MSVGERTHTLVIRKTSRSRDSSAHLCNFRLTVTQHDQCILAQEISSITDKAHTKSHHMANNNNNTATYNPSKVCPNSSKSDKESTSLCTFVREQIFDLWLWNTLEMDAPYIFTRNERQISITAPNRQSLPQIWPVFLSDLPVVRMPGLFAGIECNEINSAYLHCFSGWKTGK